MTRSKKAAKKVPVIDPYLPHAGNFGYRVSRYELDLEYKVAINRLAGTATITAVTLGGVADLLPGPVRRADGDEGVGERTATRRFQLFGRQAAHRAVVVAACGRGDGRS